MVGKLDDPSSVELEKEEKNEENENLSNDQRVSVGKKGKEKIVDKAFQLTHVLSFFTQWNI